MFSIFNMEFSEIFYDGPAVLSLIIIGLITLLLVRHCRRPSNIPPGPPLWPIVGNLPSVSGKNLIEAFRDLRQKYGDIFCLKLGPSWVVVINGYDNLKEVLVKNGDVFSDRPDNFFTRTLDHKGIIGSSGLLWHENRTFTLNTLKSFGFGKRSLQDKIIEEVQKLLKTLEDTKGEIFTLKPLVQGVFSNIVTSIVFNQRYDYDDPKMSEIRDLIHQQLADFEFAGALDILPILEKLPGDLFHSKRLKAVEKRLEEFMRQHIDEHKRSLDDDNHRDFTDAYLSEIKKKGKNGNDVFFEHQLVRICRDLILAGTDTTANNVRWAVLHMIHKPEIQEKMFKEIKDTIGLERLPDMNDRIQMPYCDAVMNETMRISNVAPVSVPRSNRTEVIFKGYRIPANSVVIPCLDSVLFDENIFPKPEEFDPERFMNGSSINSLNKFIIPFAFGKRSCPGEVLTRQELFLTLVSLVQKFKFLPAEDTRLPEIKRMFGVIFYAKEYKLRVILR